MEKRRLLSIGALVLAAVLALAAASASKVLTWSSHAPVIVVSASPNEASSTLVMPARQSGPLPFVPEPSAVGGLQANVLELPNASFDFVGVWGGYTHSTIRSTAPGLLTGKNPARISVIFGRRGEAVFIADELYSGPLQRIVGRPRVRTANPREVAIEYESKDAELYYVYTNRFVLRESGTIAYQERVDVYDRSTHNLAGTVNQRATLRRLVTADEQRRFSRPSPDQVPKRAIAAATDLEPGLLNRDGRNDHHSDGR